MNFYDSNLGHNMNGDDDDSKYRLDGNFSLLFAEWMRGHYLMPEVTDGSLFQPAQD